MIDNIMKKLEVAQSKYTSTIGDVEAKLHDKIDFEFFVQWQPSDGWTVVSYNSDVAPLNSCIEEIEAKGFLSEDQFKKRCI